MKFKTLTKLAVAIVVLAACAVLAQIVPSNPPPVINLAWDASPSPGITNYWIYYGVTPGMYTNRLAANTNLQGSVILPVRGVRFYFAVSAADNKGLESPLSNEVNGNTPTIPQPPVLRLVP